MSISLIVFIVLHVLVFAYMVEMLRRIAHRHKEYPLDETRETLPFGFLKLRYIVVLLIVTYVAWIIFSVWLYEYFLNNAILEL